MCNMVNSLSARRGSTIIIIGAMTVIATHSRHITLLSTRRQYCLHAGRMAQRVLHGIDFRGAPLNHENIGVDEAGRRADIYTRNKRRKINNHIIIFESGVCQKAILPPPRQASQSRSASRIIHCRQKCQIARGIGPDRICQRNLSSNDIKKSDACIRRKRARKRRIAKITIQQNNACSPCAR